MFGLLQFNGIRLGAYHLYKFLKYKKFGLFEKLSVNTIIGVGTFSGCTNPRLHPAVDRGEITNLSLTTKSDLCLKMTCIIE